MSFDSTLGEVRRAEDGPPPRWGRNSGALILLVIVVVAALGLLGVRSRTTTARGGGYQLTVTYAQTARAGLDVPLRFVVHHAGGFASGITLAISTDYFRMYETQGFLPDADSSTNDGQFLYLTYARPRGNEFVLDYDAYIQPAAQLGKSATVELLVRGSVVATTSLHTWLAP